MQTAGTLELQCLGMLGTWPPLMLQIFLNPKVEIDGGRVPSNWGKRNYALAPGLHTVEVSYAWIIQPHCNRARITLEIIAERTVALRYRTQLFTFAPGSLKVIDRVALAKIHKQ